MYGEMVAFWRPYWKCSWPPLQQNLTEVPHSHEGFKVAVITDPQLTDYTSHGLTPGSFAVKAIQFFTDIYMRRSFRTSLLSFEPDEIIFLGDLFDGGPYLSDKEWKESAERFEHVFDQTQRGSKSRLTGIPVHYLSGNHDIGYAGFHSHKREVIERFEKVYGETNYRMKIGSVEFVIVNAQTLDGSMNENSTSSSWNFIQNISADANPLPRILLTHIPLYRPNDTPCGAYRSSPIINQRISNGRSGIQGIMYQNYLSEDTSARLLDLIKPILVLSGHDHDQCTVSHPTPNGPVIEHTVGTFSWQQGNLYPSFMLLSVSALSSSTTSNPEGIVSTNLCFLPMQTHIYLWYASLFIITVFLLLSWPTSGVDLSYCFRKLTELAATAIRTTSKGGVKVKDEDANYEYDMVWDAEGVMHLIRKGYSKLSNANHGEVRSSARGTVVARPAAKKQTTPESDSSCVQIESETNLEQIPKGPRMTKGKMSYIVQRLFRTLHNIAVLAAVNLPLYMMLLIKDWT
ncbi:hypothetical protein SUGI_0144910 [Cryptomeria japonica]|nr:hypothetical protein SUGI_0144910 [Cryptomeria japonica]